MPFRVIVRENQLAPRAIAPKAIPKTAERLSVHIARTAVTASVTTSVLNNPNRRRATNMKGQIKRVNAAAVRFGTLALSWITLLAPVSQR